MFARPLAALALIALLAGTLSPHAAAAKPQPAPIAFTLAGSYNTGLAGDDETAGETVAYARNRMYVTNSTDNSLDIVDISDPAAPALLERIDLAPYGAGPNSVATQGQLVAVAVEADPKTDPGHVVFFNRDGRYLNQVQVGALPDMLTFSPNGFQLIVANEGEPNDDYSVDPYGTVSVIPLASGVRRLSDFDVDHVGFRAFELDGRLRGRFDPAVRIFGPTAGDADAVQKGLEPEYITVTPDGKYAYVTLQESNAIARLDLYRLRFDWVRSLGLKDHSLPGNGLDASDRDGAINIASWPVFGMYQPDAIGNYTANGRTYLVTANEGDTRDYETFGEEVRVGSASFPLDPTAFPDAAALKANPALGRLTVTSADGDLDGDGDYDRIQVFGARSFSIWDAAGTLVFDSGDALEQIVAANNPAFFNSNNDANDFDSRSDNKGPEPEGLALGQIKGRTYAFVGLERQGGIVIFDITSPTAPTFVQYLNNRDFSTAALGPDSGPEVLTFVPASKSPTKQPLLIVANEISGTVSMYTLAE